MKQLIGVLTDPRRPRLPKVIGIDNDFSPDPASTLVTGAITTHDTDFFQFCQSQTAKTHVPIFLGVYRSITNRPEFRLIGDHDPRGADYGDMAASLAVNKKNQQRLILWTRVGTDAPCLSLSSQLATAALGHEPVERCMFPFEQFRNEELERAGTPGGDGGEQSPPVQSRTYLVDYNSLDALIRSRIPYQDLLSQGPAAKQLLDKLADSIVILGSGKPSDVTQDSFTVTYGTQVPGVYLHACGVNSLISSHPIFELTEVGRPIADLLLSFSVFGSLTLASWLIQARYRKRLNAERLQKPLAYTVAAIAFIVGVVSAPLTHLLWDDFLLVLPALLLHPHLHYALTNGYKVRSLRKSTIQEALIEHEDAEHPGGHPKAAGSEGEDECST